MNKLLSLIRVRQWHKNIFVLLGFFVLGDYQNYDLLLDSIVMTAIFCLASSSVYIFNDYKDMEYDRIHPVKRNRPLAKGTINVGFALVLAVLFCLASLYVSWLISLTALCIVGLYLLNNLAYSLFFKRYPIIDVFQIGFGFMLRIFAGTSGIGIYISEWMILTGFMLSLLIGFSKRYAELSNGSAVYNQREVLKDYSEEILKSFVMITASATIITYSLYTLSPRSTELHGSTNLIYTIPFVAFGIMRFIYLVMLYKTGEDPSTQIFKDQQLIITGVIWLLVYGLIIS